MSIPSMDSRDVEGTDEVKEEVRFSSETQSIAPPAPPTTEAGDVEIEPQEGGEEELRTPMLAPKKTISIADKERPEDWKKSSTSSRQSRRASMFEERDRRSNYVPEAASGVFKEALLDLFSSGEKDGMGAGTVLKPLRRPKLVFENTFRLDSVYPFSPSRVDTFMHFIMHEMLADFVYSSKSSGSKAMEIAEKIRRHVLAFKFDRYKLCVLVTIGPVNRQGFHNGFRCLWDAYRDKHAYATFKNSNTFAIAVCYGIYFE